MSRSRKKAPIYGVTTARSDAEWKAKAARILRHRVKQTLAKELTAAEFAGKRWDAVNPWGAPKDGKGWFGDRHPAHWRCLTPTATIRSGAPTTHSRAAGWR